jgi:hypothetical protein
MLPVGLCKRTMEARIVVERHGNEQPVQHRGSGTEKVLKSRFNVPFVLDKVLANLNSDKGLLEWMQRDTYDSPAIQEAVENMGEAIIELKIARGNV